MADGAINAQGQAVAAGNAAVAGAAAQTAMALTYTTGADTIGMVMHNAVAAQHGTQTVARAATANVCAWIIKAVAG